MKIHYIYLCIIYLFISSCNSREELKSLHLTNEINKYSKDHYVNEINDIEFDNSKFYIVDSNIPGLFILNNDFNHLYSLGRKGKGPEEFLSMGAVGITSKEYYISDPVGNKLMCYDKNTNSLLRKIVFQNNTVVGYDDFFIDNEGNITAIRWNGKKQEIGFYNIFSKDFTPLDKSDNLNFKNYRVLQFVGELDNDLIVLLPRYSPDLYLISRKRSEVIKKIKVDIPKKSLLKWKEYHNKGKSTPLFTSCYLTDKTIYILFQDFSTSSKGMVELMLNSENNVESTCAYQFPPSNGNECLYVENENLITYSRMTSSLQKYKLK